MFKTLNGYGISSKNFLSAPADQSNVGGGANTTGSNEENESSQTSEQAVDENEEAFETIFGDDGEEDDDEDSGFDLLSEEEESSEANSPEQVEAAKALGRSLSASLDSLAINESDMPEDLTDRAAMAKFLSERNDKVARTMVETIPRILSYSLSQLVPKMQDQLKKDIAGSQQQGKAATAFNNLGFKGADKTLAKSFYNRALQKGIKPDAAANATRNAMKKFGVVGNSTTSGATGSIKTGKDALASLFGKS